MNKKVTWIIIAVVIIAIVWYLASPLLINKTVNEEFPIQQNFEEMQETSTILQGNFKDADSFHKTSGQALIVSDGSEKYLRFEDFKTTNGPDLYVYLTNDLDAKDYVSLGRLKGSEGSQNYLIPENVNPEDYQYAVVWCQAFSVLFGSAELQ